MSDESYDLKAIDGIYKQILQDKKNINAKCFSINKEGFVIVTENTDLDDKVFQDALLYYKKLSIKPQYLTLNIIEWFLNGIPDCITHLYINMGFYDSIILTKLPKSLKYLCIDCKKINSYNQEYYKIKNKFNLVNKFEYFNSNIDNLPSDLEELYIYSSYFNQPVDHLPFGLKVLIICSQFFNETLDHLPIGLETLIIDKNSVIDRNLKINISNLPSGLKSLYIICEYLDYDISTLPKKIERISLPNYQYP